MRTGKSGAGLETRQLRLDGRALKTRKLLRLEAVVYTGGCRVSTVLYTVIRLVYDTGTYSKTFFVCRSKKVGNGGIT